MSTGKHLALSLALALGVAGSALAADQPGLGKPVSEADLALWDMSIGPDGKGLPPGSGTPAQGAAIFAQKCEACHGKDGQGGSNAMLINPPGKSERTMATYVPYATTMFDFTRRAMPWPVIRNRLPSFSAPSRVKNPVIWAAANLRGLPRKGNGRSSAA